MLKGDVRPQGQGVGVDADFVWRYFGDVDTMDPNRVTPYYAEGGTFRFANHPSARGLLAGFYGTIRSMSHHATGLWLGDRTAVFEAEAVFERPDSSTASLPAVSVIRLDEQGKIADFRFVMDAAPLA